MKELKNSGDPIDVGCWCHGGTKVRYGMEGDTYMNGPRVGELGDALFEEAKSKGLLGWLVEAALERGLVAREWPEESGVTASAMFLAKAHVTLHQICARRS